MKLRQPLGVFLIVALIAIIGCESPGSADVNIQQKYDIPLLKSQRFQFYGGQGSFVDTTENEFDSLFTTNSNGDLFISYNDEFEIGNLDDAIPQIDIDPNTLESEIGIIEIDDFSSSFQTAVGTIDKDPVSINNTGAEVGTFEPTFEGSGSTDFAAITGISAPPNGTLINGQTDQQVVVTLSVGNFVSATVESGGISVTFTNDLGFDIDQMDAQLIADANGTPTPIGTQITFTNIPHTGNNTVNDSFIFSQGEVIEQDLQVEITLTWSNQNYQTDDNTLQVDVNDDNLVVTESEAEIAAQALTPNTPDIEISESGFSSVILSEDFAAGSTNELTLTLNNNTNLPLSNAAFNDFPEITLRNGNNEIIDAPKRAVPSSPSGFSIGAGQSASVSFDLSNVTLTKQLSYSLDLGTPGSGNGSLVVRSTDEVSISASTSQLEVSEAQAAVSAQSDISLQDTSSIEGDFVRAEVSDGVLNLSFANNLSIPLTIDQLDIVNKEAFTAKNTGQYFAAGSVIGSLSNIILPANDTSDESVDLSGKGISNEVIFDATASSQGSNGQTVTFSENDDLDISISGSISVTEATAVLNSQDFDQQDTLAIDQDSFEFTLAEHFVSLKSGELNISDIVNTLDVDVDTLEITINSILDPNNEPLYIAFYGGSRQGDNIFPMIERNENGTRNPVSFDLSGYTLKAQNNEVIYEVRGVTENTSGKLDSVRTIRSTDLVSAQLTVNNLEIDEALGKIAQERVILGDDDASNGTDIIDLNNDSEAEVVDLGLGDLSEDISNLQFNGSELSINYTTDIGTKATVFMAIAATDGDGNTFYLQGKGDNEVTAADNVSELYANGSPIAPENLIKFSFGQTATSAIDPYSGSIVFNRDNSDVDLLLSKLPEEIRTVGVAVINPDNDPSSYVSNPIQFDTELSANMPLSITSTESNPLTINFREDSVNIDVSLFGGKDEDNDGKEDETFFTTGLDMTFVYENHIPLSISLDVEFINDQGRNVDVGFTPITLNAAETDANGYAVTPTAGSTTLTIDNPDSLNSTQDMNVIIKAISANGQEIRVRKDDYLELKIGTSSEVTVQGN